jgi:hypothetical protein
VNLGVTVSMNSWIEDSCGYLTCYSFFCVVIVVKSEAVKVFDLLRSARVTVQKSHAFNCVGLLLSLRVQIGSFRTVTSSYNPLGTLG